MNGYEEIRIDPASVVGTEGFYRAGKDTEGRWWFLRPDGRPFVYKGVCAVCDGVPPHNGKPGNAHWYQYHAKFGPEDDHRFCNFALRVLQDLGFNALGMWCFIRNPGSGHEDMGWPFVEYIHAREVYPQGVISGSFLKGIDIFDPGWEQAYDKVCRDRCTKHAWNTNLLGYFVENEPFWGQPSQRVSAADRAAMAARQDDFQGMTNQLNRPTRAHRWGVDDFGDSFKTGTLLQVFLSQPDERPAFRGAWDWLLARHGGSVSQVAKAWGAAFASPEEFRRQTLAEGMVLNNEAYGRDHDAFTRFYVQTFFRVTGECIRRYDPNHLRLGVRHHARAELHGEVVLREYMNCRDHVEVFSLNTYHDSPLQEVEAYARLVDMPFLVGEYSWGGWIDIERSDLGPFAGNPQAWLRQEGVRRTAAMFTVPQMAGYTWFKWYCGVDDPDKTGYAVITDDFQVIRFNAPMFRRLHAALEDIHAGVRSVESL